MRERHSSLRLAAIGTAMLLASAGLRTMATAADGVVLFAPGEYEHLSATPYHASAAEQIHHRLLKAGIPEDRIVTLSGKPATAQAFKDALAKMTDSTGPNDLLLVVICSPGMQFDDRDYVLATDTPQDPRQGIDGQNRRIISISDVLQDMAVSASNRRVLIVDGATEAEPSLSDAVVHFGRIPLPSSDGQWVILNQNNHLNQRGDQPTLTDFIWSLLDGITFHADGNRDGSVSVLELADYMKLYAEEQRNPAPHVAGKTSGDVSLLRTSAADDEAFPRAALVANAKCLVAEARKALLLESDVRAVLALLDRAKRLCDDPDLTREIDEVLASARILNGEADRVLPLAAEAGVTYTAALPREVGLYAAGASKPSQQLPAGTIIQIANRNPVSANGQTWTYVSVVAASRPQWKAGKISFSPVEVAMQPAWMLASDLAATADQRVPIASLRQEFLKPGNVDEEPSAAAETGRKE